MKRLEIPLMRRFLKDQRGQSIVVIAVIATALMALAATSVEVGHVYYAYQRLVAATNAATLAGAQVMPDAIANSSSPLTPVSAVVTQYSCFSGATGQSAGYNTNSMLQCPVPTTNIFCSSTVSTKFNVGCETPPGGSADYNAITVTQKATVNLWFAGLVGMSKMTMYATGTAAMKGGTDIPYNLAIIMDTTASMQDTMTSGTCTGEEQIVCAIQGFTVMLQSMDPCALDTTCSKSSAFVDDVALFVFPPLDTSKSTYTANNFKNDYCTTGGDPSVPYNFYNISSSPAGLGLATTATNGIDPGAYEIIPFEDTYRANDSSTTGLTIGDALAEAVGYTNSGCKGLAAPGGQGTYYAQAIYQAQAALVAQQASYPGSQNIMIILSDGNATASNPQATTGGGGGTSQILADNCPSITTANDSTKNGNISNTTPCLPPYSGQPINGTEATVTIAGKNVLIQPAGWKNPAYPSAVGECGQAVQAAQLATTAGTTVYAIAFDSPISGGCTTDQTYTLTGLANGAVTWPGGSYSKQPCNAIAAMASNVNTFYSDYTDNTSKGGRGCTAITATNQAYQSLAQIFEAVAQGLTSPRLIPNGTK